MVTCLQCRYAFHNNAFNMTFKNETLTRGGSFQTNVNMSLKASTNKPLLGRSEKNRNETSSCCVPQYLYKTSHYRIFFFLSRWWNLLLGGGMVGQFRYFHHTLLESTFNNNIYRDKGCKYYSKKPTSCISSLQTQILYLDDYTYTYVRKGETTLVYIL